MKEKEELSSFQTSQWMAHDAASVESITKAGTFR